MVYKWSSEGNAYKNFVRLRNTCKSVWCAKRKVRVIVKRTTVALTDPLLAVLRLLESP